MTLKTHTQKDGTVWEWEETEELSAYIKKQRLSNGNSEDRRQNPTTEV